MSLKTTLAICLVISILLAFFFIEIIPFSLTDSSKISCIFNLSNFFGLIVLNFLLWYLSGRIKMVDIIVLPIASAAGLILYELIQLAIPFQTFDFVDIIFTLYAMAFCVVFNYLLYRWFRKRNNSFLKNN